MCIWRSVVPVGAYRQASVAAYAAAPHHGLQIDFMIRLDSDVGSAGLDVGQAKAQLQRHAPDVQVVNLWHAAPNSSIAASAHHLAALSGRLPSYSVAFAVVDPGVGASAGQSYFARMISGS